ncbi:hypothetical protein L596_019080 [Steinernema carpocapsae]|uniref:Ankyrin repeat domain-containing protein n=1 Tax=Steinernema carpocapsae TaxID=34508 RepID=A0A4U5N8F3_STECR|nr:hypothetical protein L596_019080 [Steinernema carpocapsae]
MATSGNSAGFPLHFCVFRNEIEELNRILTQAKEASNDVGIEKKDAYGRTPLALATALDHLECAKVLLEFGADADVQNKEMWSVSNESVCTGDPELVRLIIQHRDFQRNTRSIEAMNSLLAKLTESTDFYAEMSWEFTSWIPFVSKMCPSDTYKIYKRGAEVRIDTTLVGFDGRSTWKRGNQSFIFRPRTGDIAQFIVVDHDNHKALVQTADKTARTDIEDFAPPEEAVSARLCAPVATTYVDVEGIGFERCKTGGIFPWISSSEKSETVDGFDCKVFSASNVELVTKTRSEHLTEEDKQRFKKEEGNGPLGSVLKLIEKRQEYSSLNSADTDDSDLYGGMTAAEYLSGDFVGQRNIGKAQEITRKCNTFNATLCLAPPEYSLNLQEQILPIIDLMAANNSHFARLKNFIQLQMPGGFPVRIDIPLFHIISAQITFKNVNAPGRYVTPLGSPNQVQIDEAAFHIPEGYSILDEAMMQPSFDNYSFDDAPSAPARRYVPAALQEEEMLLQFALEQSLREQRGGSSDIPVEPVSDQYDTDLTLAIQESLRAMTTSANGSLPQQPHTSAAVPVFQEPLDPIDPELAEALRLSEVENEERQRQLQDQEDELRRVLELSKSEK